MEFFIEDVKIKSTNNSVRLSTFESHMDINNFISNNKSNNIYIFSLEKKNDLLYLRYQITEEEQIIKTLNLY